MQTYSAQFCALVAATLVLLCGCFDATQSPMVRSYPLVSPDMAGDGAFVVYGSDQTGNGDIYRWNRETGEIIRLTNDLVWESEPIIASDGKSIAFTRESKDGRHLWLMDADGKNPRQVTTGNVLDAAIGFSPSGGQILAERMPMRSIGLGVPVTRVLIQLHDSGFATVIESGDWMTMTPDGTAYFHDGESAWRITADGRDRRQVGKVEFEAVSDDHATAITALPAADNALPSEWRVINLESGRRLRTLSNAYAPRFTSDGEWIVVRSAYFTSDSQCALKRVRTNGGPKKVISAPFGAKSELRRSTNGFIFAVQNGDGSIVVCELDVKQWNVNKLFAVPGAVIARQ